MPTELAWLATVVMGGGAGSAARYAVGRAFAHFELNLLFPWHTLAVNAAGSFALGLVAGAYKAHPQPHWFLLYGVGFCGGFTTFSTYSLELVEMLEADRPLTAAGYAVGSVAAGLLGAWVGLKWARA